MGAVERKWSREFVAARLKKHGQAHGFPPPAIWRGQILFGIASTLLEAKQIAEIAREWKP